MLFFESVDTEVFKANGIRTADAAARLQEMKSKLTIIL